MGISFLNSVKAIRLTMRVWIFLILAGICLAEQERNDRMFSLFSVVQFKNDPCTSNDKISSASTTYRNGTCVTSSECIERSGSAKGNCAAGFGVCCIKIIDDDDNTDINYNDTYIQNPDYPNSYGEEGTITYKVNKLDSTICFLRLDFELFDLIATPVAAGNTQLCSGGDYIQVSNTGSGLTYPAMCGNLAGQHMYVSIGSDDSDSADIKIATPTEANGETRKWEIKVAQIPCFSDYSPPEGCTQWFTEPSGTISDWSGADNVLQDSLDYKVCVRQNMGYCCVEYTATEFIVRGATDAAAAAITIAGVGATCANNWISIDGAGGNCGNIVGTNKFCFDILHYQDAATGAMVSNIPICDCTAPFNIGVHSEAMAQDKASTGFTLNYRQLKC